MNRSSNSVWRITRLLGFAAVMLLVASSAFAQGQSGNVFGRVVDNQGAALPGVTVTLSGGGAAQVFVTDGEGNFRFVSVSPGAKYTLTAELSGFGSVVQNNVAVNIGRNTSLTLELSPALEQTITVTAETPLLDTRKTGTGATVTQIELEEVPSARDPWVILSQVPGVQMDRVNVGGNQSGQQSGSVSKGAGDNSASFNVDGVNITDMAAVGSSPAYFDFGSFEEIQVSTGGTDPRVQTPGSQLNIVTKRGTNDLQGSARYYLADGAWQSTPSIPTEAVGYLGTVNEIDQNKEWGFEVGGPIVRDRFWLWGAYADQQVDLFVGTPPSQAVRYSDKTSLETQNYKANAQLSSSNSAVGTWWNNDKTKLGRNASPTRPPETTWNQSGFGPTGIWKIEDTHIFNPNFYLTGMYSETNGGFQLIADSGAGCTDIDCSLSSATGPAYLEAFGDGAWHQSYLSLTILRPQEAQRIDGSYFFDTGAANHELKFGFGHREAYTETFYAWPFDQYIIEYNGFFGPCGAPPCDPEGDGLGGVIFHRNGIAPYTFEYDDIYVGDTILFGDLTFQVGLRLDQQATTIYEARSNANSVVPELLPAVSLPASAFGPQEDYSDVSPRFGVTYAMGESKQTLLRAAYNTYVAQLGGGTNSFNLAYSYLYMYFDDLNNDHRAQHDEIIFDYGFGGFYGVDPADTTKAVVFTRFDPDLKAQTTDEIILGVEHEVSPQFTVGVTYTDREFDNFSWTRYEENQGAGDFYTTADYELAGTRTTVLPDGRTVSSDYYALTGGRENIWGYTTNRDGYKQNYEGFEFTAVKRLSNRWMLRANYSLNDWTQSVKSEAIVDPTVQRTSYGCGVCDGATVIQGSGTGSGSFGEVYIGADWSYVITGLYQIPVIETNLGFSVNGRQGYPTPYVHRTTADSGFKYLLVDGVTSSRYDDISTIDLRLSKDFRFAGGAGLTVSVDAFNITNEQTILQRETEIYRSGSARFDANRIREMVSPQIFRFGARFTF